MHEAVRHHHPLNTKGGPPARQPEDLRRSVCENLESLGLEVLDVVNLRLGDARGPQPGSVAEPLETLAGQGIAYVPFFPLGGFSPLQSSALSAVAARLDASPMSVALAWLLQWSPNILLIPGTLSVAHLRENVAGTGLSLPAGDLAELDKIGH